MFGILIIALLIVGGASFLISRPLYLSLVKHQNKIPMVWSALVFVISFCAIAWVIEYSLANSFSR